MAQANGIIIREKGRFYNFTAFKFQFPFNRIFIFIHIFVIDLIVLETFYSKNVEMKCYRLTKHERVNDYEIEQKR